MTYDRGESTRESVYEFIRSYIRERGVSPSLREIAKHCYLSNSTVMRHLDQLEAQGRLYRHPGTARGIVLNEEK